jgi:solute carrier family 35 protein E1
MKLAVCILLAASGANALNAPKSGVAAVATHSAALQTAAPLAAKEVSAVPRGGLVANFVGVDVSLLSYFFFWYLGNYYYNISNKLALKNSGGAQGFPMTIATLQLGVGVIYALFAWAAPDMRNAPSLTFDDVKSMVPVAFCAMMAHCASVFAMSAGAVSFGQIVKAAEPAFAAVLSQFVYGKPISRAKWLCLIPVIGGVCIASLKELDFAMSALIAACSANLFAAFKGNENKKLMDTAGLKDRLGNVGNQFAVTQIMAFAMALPMMFLTEGSKWGEFRETLATNSVVKNNFLYSGLFFYGYNELATMTIKKTSAITQSVANTAKRVIVIIGVALVMGESLPAQKLVGSGICIGGVMLYSIIDDLLKKK